MKCGLDNSPWRPALPLIHGLQCPQFSHPGQPWDVSGPEARISPLDLPVSPTLGAIGFSHLPCRSLNVLHTG